MHLLTKLFIVLVSLLALCGISFFLALGRLVLGRFFGFNELSPHILQLPMACQLLLRSAARCLRLEIQGPKKER